MPRSVLAPVRIVKDAEAVKVHYISNTVELAANKPVEALPVGIADDETFVECVDPSMLAIRQIDEFGETQTLMLSPRMAVRLSRVIDSFVVLGANCDDWADGRNLI